MFSRGGRESKFAGFFDIDWGDKLLLPFLGEPLAEALEHGATGTANGGGRNRAVGLWRASLPATAR